MVTNSLESKAFIFDLDGTLIDTTPLVIKFWTNLANERNLDPNQILATSHGCRTIETLERWVPDIATVEYVNNLEARLAKEMDGGIVLPGVIDLLVFRTKIGHDKLISGKPHPEGYLLAAKIFERDPKDCLVFEDAPAGVQAAIAAGMQFIACTTTHTIEQLKEAGATVIVDHLDSVQIEKQADGSYKTIIENVI